MNTEHAGKTIHVAMIPWFAMGHISPFLRLANELASRGHKISFLLPKGIQSKSQSLSHYPNLITFHPLTVPHVDGLPPGAETATDAPFPAVKHLFAAFDRTQDQVKSILAAAAPDFVIFDLTQWVPALARELCIKPVYFHIAAAAPVVLSSIAWRLADDENYKMPPGFPSSLRLSLRPGDLASTRGLFDFFGELGAPGIRARRGVAGSEALVIWSCREIDSQFNSYLETLFQKPLFLTGPLLRRNRAPSLSPPTDDDDRKWDDWMNKFPPKSVVYCAFGSELTPDKDQFRELLLGFELCNRPFIVATTKPPRGCSTIEESFPEDFLARVEGRGKVHCGWVPQVRILGHESAGCFVSHCGSSSMWEALFSECRIVLMMAAHILQSTTTMFMVEELKVAVEVERAEDGGWVGKEELSRAIGMAMDEESELGRLLKRNHDMYRSLIMGENVQDSYTDDFICKLHDLMDV
ncbi:UDP-glycosyltransferase 79B10 [Linum perenne]